MLLLAASRSAGLNPENEPSEDPSFPNASNDREFGPSSFPGFSSVTVKIRSVKVLPGTEIARSL